MYLILLIFLISNCTKNFNFIKENKEKCLVKNIKENEAVFLPDFFEDLYPKNDFFNSLKEGEWNSTYLKEYPLHLSIYSYLEERNEGNFKKVENELNELEELKDLVGIMIFNRYVNGYDIKGFSPLHLAILSNDIKLIKLLFNRGLDLDFTILTAYQRLSAISLALISRMFQNSSESYIKENDEIINYLISKNPKFGILDKNKISELGYAALTGQYKIVEKLTKEFKYSITHKETSPLSLAILNNHYEIVEYLFENGGDENWDMFKKIEFVSNLFSNVKIEKYNKLSADCKSKIREYIDEYKDRKDQEGKTPILYSIEYNNENNVKELLHDKDFKKYFEEIDTIFAFAKKDNAKIIQKLIDHGVDIDKENSNQETCINIALENKAYETVKILIENSKNLSHINKEKLTYFHIIAYKDNIELFEKLLDKAMMYNINVKLILDSQSNKGNTALHIASKKGNIKIVELLLKNNVELDLQNVKGKTALHYAVEKENEEGFKKLIGKYNLFNFDKQDKEGKTALHCAVKIDNEEFVRELLRVGADSNKQDIKGNTPLHYAVLNKNFAIISLLLENDANILVQNKDKLFPRDLTNEYNILLILDPKNNYSPPKAGFNKIVEEVNTKPRKNSNDEGSKKPLNISGSKISNMQQIEKSKEIFNILSKDFGTKDIEDVKKDFERIEKDLSKIYESDPEIIRSFANKLTSYLKTLNKASLENLERRNIKKEIVTPILEEIIRKLEALNN